jgi:hypothetical protein
MAMASDATGGLVAIGGAGFADSALNEVLRLSSELSTEPHERCLVAAEDSDGDGLAGCADPDCWLRCNPACAPGASCIGPRCGDGTCHGPREDYLICPADCPAP